MSHEMTRREALVRGVGLAGVLAAGRLGGAFAAEPPPDRSKGAPTSPVAIQRCESYEPAVIRKALDESLKLIGGIDSLVRGKTVTVKINLTGRIEKLAGLPAWRTYHTHPGMVAAMCGALADAGAKKIVIVESFYYREPFEKVFSEAGWDIPAILSAGDGRVSFENTRNKGSWSGYSRLKVPWGGYLFPAFDLNQRYEKTDVFVSLAKLKDHASAGVTVACKNLFGIMPLSLYGDDSPDEQGLSARVSNLHMAKKKVPAGVPGELEQTAPAAAKEPWQYRVPRATADLVVARPVDLAIIEGIQTIRGGEGPWNKGVEPVEPKLLLAGRNPVCTDAVCATLMGYDPQADHFQFPFPGENHLKLLAQAGVGTIDLKQIEVRGLPVDKAAFRFRTPPEPGKQTAHASFCRSQYT